jgi:hypothetical protein
MRGRIKIPGYTSLRLILALVLVSIHINSGRADTPGSRYAESASESTVVDTPLSRDAPPHRRIVDRKKGESTRKRIARFPLRIVTFPLWLVDRGIYSGLLAVEEKSLIPRTKYYQGRLRQRGLFPVIGGTGDGAGFGGGISWRIHEGKVTPTVSAAASIKGYQNHGLGLDFSDLFSGELGVALRLAYQSSPEEDFFGIGPDSREADRTSYHREETTLNLVLDRAISGPVHFEGRAAYSNTNIFGGEDDRFPSTEELFTGQEAPGLIGGAELISGEASLVLDLRDHPGNATSGGLVKITLGVTEDADGDVFDTWRYALELRGYLPLLGRGNRFGPRSLLAVRLRGDFNESRGSGVVPFFTMPYLGGSSTMRGFREFRFFDRDAIVANVEYRYRLQALLEAVLFLDEGQVRSNIDDFDMSGFRESFGGGIRVAFRHGVFFRLEVGKSSEGVRTFSKFTMMF